MMQGRDGPGVPVAGTRREVDELWMSCRENRDEATESLPFVVGRPGRPG